MSPIELTVPKFGVSTEYVVIVEWLKETGDDVAEGEPVVLVETDKATVEIEATHTGTLAAKLAETGAELGVGDVYARLNAAAVHAASPTTESPTEATTPEKTRAGDVPLSETPPIVPAVAMQQVGTPPPAPGEKSNVPATPSARAAAKSQGIDLADVAGSGPGGRVRRRDVQGHVGERNAPGEAETGGLSTDRWIFRADVVVPDLPDGPVAVSDVVLAAVDHGLEQCGQRSWHALRVRTGAEGVTVEQTTADVAGRWEPAEGEDGRSAPVAIRISEVPGLIPSSAGTQLGCVVTIGGSEITITFEAEPRKVPVDKLVAAAEETCRLAASPAALLMALLAERQ